VGDYNGSLVESDGREEPEARIVQEPNSYTEYAYGQFGGASEIHRNPDGTYGTSILQPINPAQWASISSASTASVTPQAYTSFSISPPQTVSNGGTVAFDGSAYVETQSIPEGHPFPSSDHDPATCRICIVARRREEEHDEEIDIENHENYSETNGQE
jgi:hypothetical protein